MADRLRVPLREVAAELFTFQLLESRIPKPFDDALQDTEVTKVRIKEVSAQKDNAAVVARNRLWRVEEEAVVIRNQKETEAQKITNTLLQQKATFIAQIAAEVSSYKALQTQVELTPRNLLNYIWLQSVGEGAAG